MATATAKTTFTTGDAARHFGVLHWQILHLYKRKLLPEPPRIGIYRVIAADDLPALEAALRSAGYLPGTANVK